MTHPTREACLMTLAEQVVHDASAIRGIVMNRTECERLHTIYHLFQQYNEAYFNGIIPTPYVRLSPRMTRRAGHVTYEPWAMAISIPYHERYGWGDELQDTVKHEMVHLCLKTRSRPSGHTLEFKAICKQIGASRYAKPMLAPLSL